MFKNVLKLLPCILQTCSSIDISLRQWIQISLGVLSAGLWPGLCEGHNESTSSRGNGVATVLLCTVVYSVSLKLMKILFQDYVADTMLCSFSYLFCLLFSLFIPLLLVFVLFCYLGLLYRKTLIECLLMLWPLCLHPAFYAALTPLTHCKVYRISVRLQRKAIYHHLCRTSGTSDWVGVVTLSKYHMLWVGTSILRM
jgi:hypothetical protein